MSKALRLLIVENKAEDVDLLVRELRHGGYEPSYLRVDNAIDLLAALSEQEWDLIISDYALPQFDALAALECVAQTGLDLPFIVISGTAGEATAIEAMKAGAHDYIMKDNLTGMVVTIERELRQAVARQQHRIAEDALLDSEARYRDLFENANDAIYTHDLEGNILSINNKGEKLTGYKREELTGQSIALLLNDDNLQIATQYLTKRLAGNTDDAGMQLEILTKAGKLLPIEVNSRLIYKGGKPVAVQGIARDISERRNLEEQFRQSQKMEAIGRLAGGLAHDFNNLLTAIIGYSQLAQLRLGKHPVQKDIGEIEKAAQRAATLTQQLLAFSRKQMLQPKIINLNEIASGISKMIKRLIGENIKVTTRLADDIGLVQADPNQMEQILLNLAVNARDAMPDGGKLIIETANYEFAETDINHHIEMAPGPYVMLAVSDTGMGMDKKTLEHIFEPFFTTKEMGKGTGLGLSTVYGIIRQSGGTIWAYSEPGRGTTFKIYMPCVADTDAYIEVDAPITEQLTGTETILIVEDEDVVREPAMQILKLQGYQVMEAADAEEAIHICESYKDEIHLVISDVVMPNLSGRQLVERLYRLRPSIKVLYISGYTDDAIIHHGIVGGEMPFLQKPFTHNALARKVREVLDVK